MISSAEKDMNTQPSAGPPWQRLFHGAVREALAASNSVARIGTQDTHAWERPIRYISDDNQGNVAVVEFQPYGAVGAMSARDPGRPFDWGRAVALAPAGAKEELVHVCQLPLLGDRISALFWTVGEHIHWPERESCAATQELLRRELLADSAWEDEARAYYDLTLEVARLVVAAAARALVRIPMLRLSERELRLLVPRGSTHEREALDLLTSDGLFDAAPNASD
jgi:hypothetical protein